MHPYTDENLVVVASHRKSLVRTKLHFRELNNAAQLRRDLAADCNCLMHLRYLAVRHEFGILPRAHAAHRVAWL